MSTHVLCRRFLCLALLMSSASRMAIAEPTDGGPEESSETVVSAPRVVLSARDRTTTIAVIDREELTRTPAFTADALVRLEPAALTFRRSSSLVADPSSQGINLRGLGPSGVSRALVLLDGFPLNDGFGGWVYWRAVPVIDVERIDIALGPASAVWGSSAMGGVIRMSSRPIVTDQADADVSFGSFNTIGVAARAASRRGSLAASLEAELLRSDGYPVVASYDRGAIDKGTPSQHGSLNGRLEWTPAPGVKLTARTSAFAQEQSGGTAYTRSTASLSQGSLFGEWRMLNGNRLEAALLARTSLFSQERPRVDARRDTEVSSARQQVPVSEQGVFGLWSLPPARLLGTHLLSAGFDFRRVAGTSTEALTLAARQRVAGGEQQFGGAFIQDSWSPTSFVEVSGALRLDIWRNANGFTSEREAAGQVVERHTDRTHLEVNPRVGIFVRPTPWLALRASGARAFRAPTLNELYRPFQVGTILTAANPSLSAESVVSGELGIEATGPAGLSGRATGYLSEWQSPIVNVSLETPLPSGAERQRQNLGTARIHGAELAIQFKPNTHARARIAYVYASSIVVSAPAQSALIGKQLPQAPQHRGVASFTFDAPNLLCATIQVRVLGPQFEDDANQLPMAGFVLLDASLSRRLWRDFDVYLAAENLMDRSYLVGRAGIDTIGQPFTVRAGLRLHVPGDQPR